MLSKRPRERILLLPHESARVRRGCLIEAAAGGLTPEGRQNLPHDVGGRSVRPRHPGLPPERGVLKPRNSSQEIPPLLKVRDFQKRRNFLGTVSRFQNRS